MRTMLLLLAWGAGLQAARGQFAIGAFGGTGVDQVWTTSMRHLGMLGECRTSVVPTAVVRASVTWHLPVVDHNERSASAPGAGPDIKLISGTTERKSILVAAFDLKWPFQNQACTDGFYKGAYFFAGIGWALRSRTTDRWTQDPAGVVTTSHADQRTGQASLRFGFGGEWNFPWGAPFVEGLITATNSTEAYQPTFLFPGTLSCSIGYRFSFAHPVPEDGTGQ